MTHSLAIGSLSFYTVATIMFLLSIVGLNSRFLRLARYCVFAAVILQTFLLLPVFESFHQSVPGDRGLYLFALSWLLALLYIFLGKRTDFPLVGAFVASASAFFLSASSYLSHREHWLGEEGNQLLVFLHVVPAFLAELALVIAFIISAIYLVQDRRIKYKKSNSISGGPSLDWLDKANLKVLLAGFISMTLAIVSGTLWGMNNHRLLLRDSYQWIALMAWLLMAILLHGRRNMHWSAKRTARTAFIATSGIILLMTALIVFQGNTIHLYAD